MMKPLNSVSAFSHFGKFVTINGLKNSPTFTFLFNPDTNQQYTLVQKDGYQFSNFTPSYVVIEFGTGYLNYGERVFEVSFRHDEGFEFGFYLIELIRGESECWLLPAKPPEEPMPPGP